MAHIRKETRNGQLRWRAVWNTADGKRHSKTFDRQGDAKSHLKTIELAGPASNITVTELGALHYRWFDGLVSRGQKEPGTRDGYATALDLHVARDPVFAKTRLCDLTSPKVQGFLDRLAERSGEGVAKRVRRTLVIWCGWGQQRGHLTANVAAPCKIETTKRVNGEDEDKAPIPAREILASLLDAALAGPRPERDNAVLHLLMFAGLRSSELLGLADEAVTLAASSGRVKVRERLERRYVTLGSPKSARGRREVPIGASAARAIKAWRLARGGAPEFIHKGLRREARTVPGRLFSGIEGQNFWAYDDFLREFWHPLMTRAGLLSWKPDSTGKQRPATPFGPHTLRHVAVSLWIAQGLAPKKVQELVGHSTLQLTMDTYGHLWADEAEDTALAQGSEALLRPTRRP